MSKQPKTSLEFIKEIDGWLSFNQSPDYSQISDLRRDIASHLKEVASQDIRRVRNEYDIIFRYLFWDECNNKKFHEQISEDEISKKIDYYLNQIDRYPNT